MGKTIMVHPETGATWSVAPDDVKRFLADGFVEQRAERKEAPVAEPEAAAEAPPKRRAKKA